MQELDFVTIGKKIRKRRKSLKMTQESIAEKLDVNPSHISNIECARANPSLTALVNIANILNCSVDYFIDGEYVFEPITDKSDSIDEQIIKKLELCDSNTKTKISKIIDIL